jgi:hypothetical protein
MRAIYARLLKMCVLLVAMISCGLPIPSQPPVSATSLSSGPVTGAGGEGGFTPTTPITDVCSLLTLADIQTVLPAARPGAEQLTPDTSDIGFWSRDCNWDVSDTSVEAIELVIFGATTEQGLAGIKAAALSGRTNSPVAGLGEDARYWVDDVTGGLWAFDGSLSVDITAYFLTPMPTEEQLHPLVAKVLGEIR